MLKRIKKTVNCLTISLFCCMLVMSGCSLLNNAEEESSSAPKTSSAAEVSDDESSIEESTDESIVESSAEESSEVSDEESFEDESSEEIVEESSEPEESKPDEESSNTSEEPSQVSLDESQAAEVSIDGYQFDDEQIVSDYHTATEFTSNEEFNAIFAENALDKEYNQEQQTAEAGTQMRTITAEYSGKWKDMVNTAFNELNGLLEDKPDEQAKLVQSQDEWIGGLAETESSFYSEADGAGTEGLLAAEAAVMNYYKGRAAVLLEQIYELNGEIDLSTYGL